MQSLQPANTAPASLTTSIKSKNKFIHSIYGFCMFLNIRVHTCTYGDIRTNILIKHHHCNTQSVIIIIIDKKSITNTYYYITLLVLLHADRDFFPKIH